jgi:hypothetical protein
MVGSNERADAMPASDALVTIPGEETRLRYASPASLTGNCHFLVAIRECGFSSKNV